MRSYLKQKQKDKISLVEKDGKFKGLMTYHSTRINADSGPACSGDDSLAIQLEEFQQSQNLKPPLRVVVPKPSQPTSCNIEFLKMLRSQRLNHLFEHLDKYIA